MTKRGTLKVYLGFAPGVGKTCAMLNEAHDLQSRGIDVLVGLVEDHGRERTKSLIDGLPVLPRKEFSYRGGTYTDLDVDAALAAHPNTILVDELAHTVVSPDAAAASSDSSAASTEVDQAEGRGVASDQLAEPEKKRWHDVYTLLDAGINVISTMNIQHLESLNDVVAAVTGTRQRETVPDQVLRDADEIELVDLTPDALRIRLARGEVYRQQQAETALNNYFKVGNLTALRELALLWLADKVEEVLETYRKTNNEQKHWPTRERVVVAVQGDSGSEAIIRRGARVTGRVAGREMIVVHVAGEDDALATDTPKRLRRLQELTDSLGGQWRVVVGDDVADSLLEFARAVNASQLVIGLGGRISRIFGGGLSGRIIDGSGPIDVHIVSTLEQEKKTEKKRLQTTGRFSVMRLVTGWIIALAGPFLLTAAAVPLNLEQSYLGALLLGFLTIVVFAALAGGMLPALAAVVIGSLLANWFFTKPTHTFTVTEPESLTQIIFFFIIAAAVAWVVELSERRRALATQRLGQAMVLSDLARGVVHDGDDIPQLLNRLCQTFQLRRVDLQRYSTERKMWVTLETTDPNGISTPWAGESTHVGVGDGLRLLVGGGELSPQQFSMIEAHGARITAIIDRQEIDAMRRATAALEAGNRVGTALLTAVSHDLRTPLAGIKAAVSGLTMDDIELDDESRQLLIETIESSTDRLETVIGNLLDMSRLNSNTVTIRNRAVDVAEVIEAVCAELPEAASHITVELPDDARPVRGDAGLVQRILSNIVINARKYAPDSDLLIKEQAVGDTVEISVIDHGPGIPDDKIQEIFMPFQRLGDQNANSVGLGLGLAVAQGFAEAMDGSVRAEHTPGGGATLVLTLPAADGTE